MEMQFRFEDDDLKLKLEYLASSMGLSLNALVNLILRSEFSKQEAKGYKLMKEIAEFRMSKSVLIS